MSITVPLPRGHSVELCDPEEITGEQKRTYQLHVDKALFGDSGGQPSYVPDPDNPALMKQVSPERNRLAADEIMTLRDMVHGWCITGWSYDLPLPFTAESLKSLPAVADDAIEDALTEHGHYDIFNGTGPKAETATTTSASTSPGELPVFPPEPASGLSAGASG